VTNRLAGQTSPYLRQHVDNPVDWYPWGDDAFEAAKRRNVPILLSVGYSACHWCHVMAHECFEDNECARLMNALFVNVKIDREERPDVDAIYMDAVQAMTGRGGWPMTVFLTPDGKPFYGGTYFPKPAFLQLMNAINDAWRNRRTEIDDNVNALMEALSRTTRISARDEAPGIDTFDKGISQLVGSFDATWGGFGGAPKFPGTMNIEVLLREILNSESEELQRIVATTLDAMASGGMYDHIGGGFSRYSVDEKWLVPHFEKMLYDQALLARTYLHASLVFGNDVWRQVAQETIDYVLRDLRHPDGGFFSAEDADSLDEHGHSHEGYFYVFHTHEFDEALPTELAAEAKDWFGITDSGNFEGKNIPTRLTQRGNLVRPESIERARTLLYDYRERRRRPGLDDKVLLEWNAMMLSTIAEAAWHTQRSDWLAHAIANGEFLLRELRDEHGVWHRSWQADGQPPARHRALAMDLAHVVDAFTRLAEASGQARWIGHACEAADRLITDYWDDEHGGVFSTARDGETLIVRQKDIMDNATPSANSTAALALLRLSALTGNADYERRALAILRLLGSIASSAPSAFGHLLAGIHLQHVGITEVAVTGNRQDLLDVLRSRWLPTTVIAWGEPYESPLWDARSPDMAYVCRRHACMAPSTSPETLLAALRDALTTPSSAKGE
jgi:uncharacterized protein YyaL (SSP411 family)